MLSMFKRTNAKEHVVGWYNTGPKLRENDLDIHGLFNDLRTWEYPYKLTVLLKRLKRTQSKKARRFLYMCFQKIAAYEVEEIGVEHLLRDVKDTAVSSLATESLDGRLREIRSYLDPAIDGKLPLNHKILYYLQDVFNLLPKLNATELIKAFAVKTSGMMLVIYLATLIRCVIALHNLINNKMHNKKYGRTEDSKPVSVPAAAGS